MREQGKDWTGNSVYLWAIANAVYMSLLGPQGFREVGELILHAGALRRARARARSPGVRLPFPQGFFKEFVVDFDGTGKTVARDQQGAAASTASSAARTSRRSFPSSARARSTA